MEISQRDFFLFAQGQIASKWEYSDQGLGLGTLSPKLFFIVLHC